MQSPSPILEAARDIVLRAGDIIRENHRKPRQIRYKGRIDIVTDTDVEVERFIRGELSRLTPDVAFMGEEGAAETVLTGDVWILDPLDGTINFTHGLPFVATSLALWRSGHIECGIVNLPLLDECFWAERGKGAFCNGERISASDVSEPDKSLLATGFPYDIREVLPLIMSRFSKALQNGQGVRRCGAAAMDLAYVAAGRFDGFFEEGLKPWDMAAGWLLVEEAGGTVSRLDGSAFALHHPDILASARDLHPALVKVLNAE
ncbi:inositol monophosphatase [Desulfovibrio sp. OttesenSCG-928-C06]|nr:inositol monophosphatase [Desulfovibrio sp. OttesenSCG-928-C06]